MSDRRSHHRLGPLFSSAWSELVLVVALFAATVAVYLPVKQHPFLPLDDTGYVVNNAVIHQLNWQTVRWSFTTFHASNWHPVTWLSHALDYRLFGPYPGGHHEMNLLLHALNALVLFWVLSQATGSRARSFMVAALFALHPINVESVAWIAERKNLLSMFFFLLALGAYCAYARRPGIGRYLVVAVLFSLGLMSKPQVITLPFVLLLWDYWPLERIAFRSSLYALRQKDVVEFSGEKKRIANGEARASREERFSWLVLEKLPLLALAVPSAILTIKAQRAGGTIGGALNSFSLSSRLGNSVLAYLRYIEAAIWPTHLAFFYPHARTAPPAWQLLAASVFLIAITVWTLANRSQPYLAVGWLWYLGTLIPMIGLVQVGRQAMADRYAYLPLIGLFIAVCWGIADATARWQLSRIWVPVAALAILVALASATRRQLSYWDDDLTLWTHSAAVVKNNYEAEDLIGETLLRRGDSEAAIAHFRASAAMDPRFTFPRLHIGIYEEEHHHPYLALQQFQQVLDLTQPDARLTPVLRTTALTHMSYVYNQLGDYANQQKYLEMAAQQNQQ